MKCIIDFCFETQINQLQYRHRSFKGYQLALLTDGSITLFTNIGKLSFKLIA